jgi:hypothetical protein
MSFLLAKIFFLLLLAAACGALFAWWYFRRHYQDVTLEYAREREQWALWRTGFEERLAARPEVDLQPLAQRQAALESALRALAVPAAPPAPDLAPLNRRLTAIEHALFPVQTRLDELTGAIRALRPPAPPTLELTAAAPDLAPGGSAAN